MSLVDLAQVAGAVIALLGLLVALFSALSTSVNERRRSQPIVVAEEWRGPGDDDSVYAYMTNRGLGDAFNVRMGVRVGGKRAEPDGVLVPVLARGERRPATEGWKIALPTDTRTKPRSYWCSYENAAGKLWQSELPAGAAGELRIRKVPWSRLRAWVANGRSLRR